MSNNEEVTSQALYTQNCSGKETGKKWVFSRYAKTWREGADVACCNHVILWLRNCAVIVITLLFLILSAYYWRRSNRVLGRGLVYAIAIFFHDDIGFLTGERSLTWFSRSRHSLTLNISQTATDTASYYRRRIGLRMALNSMTLSDLWPTFQGHNNTQRSITPLIVSRVWSIQWFRGHWSWVTVDLDFKVTGLS